MAGEIGCWPFHGWCDILKTMNLLLDMLLASPFPFPRPKYIVPYLEYVVGLTGVKELNS